MKVFRRLCLILVLLLIFLSLGVTDGAEMKRTQTSPCLKNGGKWKIAYCEPYEYKGYADTLYYTAKALKDMGWIDNIDGIPYVAGQKDSKQMWEWLSKNDVSKYIEFPMDAFYSFEFLDPNSVNQLKEKIFDRFNKTKDIDLLLVMGTKAAQQVANTKHSVPTLVFSTSNAVQAGIIKSVEDSGYDHIWAHMDPNRYKRQLEVFHDIIGFKKLGVVYEDTVSGRTFSAVDDIEAVAAERNFQIVRAFADNYDGKGDKNEFYHKILEAHKKLSKEVDAMYLGTNSQRELKKLPELLQPFHDAKIPVFSQDGVDEMKYGAMLSLSKADLSGMGQFAADTVAACLNGVPPRKLTQVYENTPTIAINLKVAKMIGYKPPFDVMLVADKIYLDMLH